MKAILISIKPKWCELIANGKKTIEVRKTKPKIDVPFKCYIYCTNEKTIGDIILCKSKENSKLFGYNVVKGINKGFAKKEDINLKGRVIGEFVCDRIITAECGNYAILPRKDICLDAFSLLDYADEKTVYGWHITDLVIYDNPKELGEFKYHCKYEFDDDFKHCDSCEYYYFSNTPMNGREEWCSCDGIKALKRPPQSWCYVEELGV